MFPFCIERVVELKNPILNSFLENENGNNLYEEFLKNPTRKNKENLETNFEMYVVKIRLLAYFSQSIYFASQKYDKKQRQYNIQNQLILDKAFDEEGETLLSSLTELIEGEELPNYSELEKYFEDEVLYKAISKLNLKQKEILYLSYVKQYKDGEIADIYGISQQAINKQKNKALEKVRKSIQ